MKNVVSIATPVCVSLVVSLSIMLADSISRAWKWHDFAMKMVEENVSLTLEVEGLRMINGIMNYNRTNSTDSCRGRSTR